MDLKKRIETDYIGEKQIPGNAYYGINAIRGFENCKRQSKHALCF